MSSLGAIDSLPYPAPTPPSKPTVVIVPGAFHTAAHFHPLSRYLERQDSKSIIMRLPSSWQKASTPTAGMAEDVNSIRRLIEELVWDEEGGDGKWGGTADADDEDEKKGSRDTTAKTNDDKNHPSTFYFPYRDISTPRPITPDPGKKDVVLVMHASGAVSGCQAITGLSRTQRKQLGKKGGVIGLFFICGLLVSEGESLESTMLGMGEATVPEFAELDVSFRVCGLVLRLID